MSKFTGRMAREARAARASMLGYAEEIATKGEAFPVLAVCQMPDGTVDYFSIATSGGGIEDVLEILRRLHDGLAGQSPEPSTPRIDRLKGGGK